MHPTPSSPKRMLPTKEAADSLGLSKSTLDKMRVFGGGPHFLKLGRRVVYDPTDLDKWLALHRRTSTSEHEVA